MQENLKRAYEFYIEKTGDDISIEQFQENIEKLKNKEYSVRIKEKSEAELCEVVGGKNELKKVSALVAALAMLSPSMGNYQEFSYSEQSAGYSGLLSSAKAVQTDGTIQASDMESYIKDAKISPAEEKVAEIIKNHVDDTQYQHISNLDQISSERKMGDKSPKLTEVEQILDQAVRDGDLPIRAFTVKELKKLKEKCKPNGNYTPNYFVVQNDCDAIMLQYCSANEAIVQIASSFAAMESISSEFSPVKYWYNDKTQGPMAALQSLAACKHRESAVLLGRLPDAIKSIVESFELTVKRGIFKRKKKIKITEKYKNLYKYGYLQLFEIGEENIGDLLAFADHLVRSIENLKINAQWVRCEDTGNKQFQVFCAAPSFQEAGDIDWDDDYDPRVPIFKEVCEKLVVEQYRAMAQIAAVRSVLTGKQEELHLYQVGQGAFYNPKTVMPLALEAVQKELEGYNVRVFLHNGYKSRCDTWTAIMNKLALKSMGEIPDLPEPPEAGPGQKPPAQGELIETKIKYNPVDDELLEKLRAQLEKNSESKTTERQDKNSADKGAESVGAK